MDICIDYENEDQDRIDFESFRFIQFSGATSMLSNTGCQTWEKIDVTRNRLIGFRVITGQLDGRTNIRSIGPILDSSIPCSWTELTLEPIDILMADLGSGIVKEPIVALDSISRRYFEQDGYSYCGQRTYTFAEERPWLSAEDGQLIVTTEHNLMAAGEVQTTLTVSIDGTTASASTQIHAAVVCRSGQKCFTQAELDCMPDTHPVERTLYEGHEGDNRVVDKWTLIKEHYMLTELTMYADSQEASGFKVKFEAWPKDVFPDYPAEYHTYGTTDKPPNVITFDSDLKKIKICVDAYPAASDIYHDFENLEFETEAGVITLPSTGCVNWLEEDLTENRLIGF